MHDAASVTFRPLYCSSLGCRCPVLPVLPVLFVHQGMRVVALHCVLAGAVQPAALCMLSAHFRLKQLGPYGGWIMPTASCQPELSFCDAAVYAYIDCQLGATSEGGICTRNCTGASCYILQRESRVEVAPHRCNLQCWLRACSDQAVLPGQAI
jgi:hypothetical protein